MGLQEVVQVLQAAIEASVYVAPTEPGLTGAELFEIGKRRGLKNGAFADLEPDEVGHQPREPFEQDGVGTKARRGQRRGLCRRRPGRPRSVLGAGARRPEHQGSRHPRRGAFHFASGVKLKERGWRVGRDELAAWSSL